MDGVQMCKANAAHVHRCRTAKPTVADGTSVVVMESDSTREVIPLRPDGEDPVVGPVVTPDPVPTDDMVLKMSLAAAGGAIIGSLVVYRWLSRRIVFQRR